MSLQDDAPLGVFDSGLGGLTVVRELLAETPAESIVYLGDTARVPYGTRSRDTVIRYARSCARVLQARGVKAIVVACNTVSAVALDELRAEFDLPVIGVVEPGAAAAVDALHALGTGRAAGTVGVLGTAGTIASGAYSRAVAQLESRVEVRGQAAPLLVPLVEEGWLDGEVPELAVERYARPLIEAGAAVVVLGCTHYPLLRTTVERVTERLAGRPVPVVDSAHATAQVVRQFLSDGRIRRAQRAPGSATLELLVTDRPAGFAASAARFLGHGELPDVEQIDLPTAD